MTTLIGYPPYAPKNERPRTKSMNVKAIPIEPWEIEIVKPLPLPVNIHIEETEITNLLGEEVIEPTEDDIYNELIEDIITMPEYTYVIYCNGTWKKTPK